MSNFDWLAAQDWRAAAHGDLAFDSAAPALDQTIIVPLAHLGAFRAAGADCDSFLQNQLSNDVRELAAGRAQLNSYNSPKGRVLDVLTLRRDGDGVLLETRMETLPATLKRLRMFVLRSKVTLEDVSASHSALGLAGPQAEALLRQAGLPVPEQDWQYADGEGFTVLRRPGNAPRFSLHAAPPQLETLWPKLAATARPAGTARWRLLDILAGLPAIRTQTADHFVAQMLNLDRLGGISFSKGCYPGQEIVARMHYLGNLKRRMFLGYTGAAEVPPGTAVHVAGEAQAAGEVVESAPHPQRGHALLAVLQLGHAGGELRLGGADGAAVSVEPLVAAENA
jgi:tRNA-modifying protein YgfZ